MRRFIFPSCFNFKPTNPAQLPWQSNPVQRVFWYCKVLKRSCCDLAAVAVPSQVAVFPGESFQIKTFSQKTLKLCCRRALPPCFVPAFEVEAWRERYAVRFIMLVLPNMQHIWIYDKYASLSIQLLSFVLLGWVTLCSSVAVLIKISLGSILQLQSLVRQILFRWK